MRCPAVAPTIALVLGIGAGIFLVSRPVPPAVFALAAISLWLIAALAFVRHRDRVFVAAIIAGFTISGLAMGSRANDAALHTALERVFDRHVPPDGYQLFAAIEGTLRADALRGPNGVSLLLEVDRIDIAGRSVVTAGGAVVSVGGDLASGRLTQWRAGRRLRLPAMLRKPAVYLDPGVANARRDFGWKGTSLVGSVKSDALVEVVARGSTLAEALGASRAGVRSAVAATVAPWSDRSAAVVNAILIGDRAGLGEEMQRQLQEAGTYHVIAISGGNIAILAGVCVMVLRLFRSGPRTSAALIILTLVAYLLVIGGGSSVGRATLMAVIYFAAQLWDHRSTPGNVAAVSAAALFCANPLEVVDASFALTFGATLGLLIGMPMLKRPARMPSWIYFGLTPLAASICAETALLPVGAVVFSRVTGAGLLLNFVAIPLMTLVQFAGMLAVALTGLNMRAALLTGYVAHLGVRGILASASLVDVWPWMVKRVPPPSAIVILAYYTAVLIVILLTMQARSHRSLRALRTAALCAATVSIWWMIAAPVVPTSLFGGPGTALRVTFIDVGQGTPPSSSFPTDALCASMRAAWPARRSTSERAWCRLRTGRLGFAGSTT